MHGFARRVFRQRLQRVLPYIYGDVLDLDCGAGDLLAAANGRVASYTGVALSANRVRQLRSAFPRHTFLQRDLEEDTLDFDRRFDVVLIVALLEHVYNQKHLLREASRVLKPAGRIVITSPTPFGNDMVRRVAGAFGLGLWPEEDNAVIVYNRHRFNLLARDFGLEVERYRTFQLGCYQLVVLRRPRAAQPEPIPGAEFAR